MAETLKCDDARLLLSMAIDGELDPDGQNRLEEHLAGCDACRTEQARYQRLAREMTTMKLSVQHDRALDRFEHHVYARLERGVAWILVSVSAILLLAGGGYYMVSDFLLDPEVPLIIRLGTGIGVLGLVVLAVNVTRHRLATYRSDPYKGVER